MYEKYWAGFARSLRICGRVKLKDPFWMKAFTSGESFCRSGCSSINWGSFSLSNLHHSPFTRGVFRCSLQRSKLGQLYRNPPKLRDSHPALEGTDSALKGTHSALDVSHLALDNSSPLLDRMRRLAFHNRAPSPSRGFSGFVKSFGGVVLTNIAARGRMPRGMLRSQVKREGVGRLLQFCVRHIVKSSSRASWRERDSRKRGNCAEAVQPHRLPRRLAPDGHLFWWITNSLIAPIP